MSVQAECWFGVRSLFRTFTEGVPSHTDDDFDLQATLVEERVVLCRAVDATEAIAKVERLHVEVQEGYANAYGQVVRQTYLGACDAYQIEGDPEDGREVYSATRLMRADVSNESVIEQVLGPEVTGSDRLRRIKFLQARIAEDLSRMV